MSSKTIEPTPAMATLPKGSKDKIKYIDRNSILIRGMGNKYGEIVARFFKRLNEKDLKNVFLSTGELIDDGGLKHDESREYYFIRKDWTSGHIC